MRSVVPSLLLLTLCPLAPLGAQEAGEAPQSSGSTAHKTLAETVGAEAQHLPGWLDLYWNEHTGKLWLALDRFDQEMLYVVSLPAGVGSNDIGLDRGQTSSTRIVSFHRVGQKVLLVQPNERFRAVSDNSLEVAAVREAFAESILWGFEVAAEEDGRVLVDATAFALHDAHGVAQRLRQRGQGTYQPDASRSALYMARTKSFPKNTEIEATLTFKGDPQGAWIRSVAPDPSAVTVREHRSFVELPGPGYHARAYDPRSGFNQFAYADYAQPIGQPLVQRFIERHRLAKRDPSAAVSDPVEPIVYYLDPGTPEPIRSALLEGAGWWNQAFEAAGYRNAFQVHMLPDDADPMDVRYNVIEWVHRSTRGWSYGETITDPRTGEIIKGQVTLGSLRVRQDYLIAEALLAPYNDRNVVSPRMQEMALARLRQLAAHEVGHTLGLRHNYISSADGRASVMDYPHPLIRLDQFGEIDLTRAYATGIGAWDKRAILFGYSDFPEGTDEVASLDAIVRQSDAMDLRFIEDQDARPLGSANPYAHLWDNGADAADELEHLLAVRQAALQRFGESNVPFGEPLSRLQDVLVPLYLLHRYQVEAAAKVVGGLDYRYALHGDGGPVTTRVPGDTQRHALQALLHTLDVEVLRLPPRVRDLIPPVAPGYPRSRESFPSRLDAVFDPLSAAEVAADLTLSALLQPARASRLVDFHARDAEQPGLEEVLGTLFDATVRAPSPSGYDGAIKHVVDAAVVRHTIALARAEEALPQARGVAMVALEDFAAALESNPGEGGERAHRRELRRQIELYLEHPDLKPAAATLRVPDGSPIGGG